MSNGRSNGPKRGRPPSAPPDQPAPVNELANWLRTELDQAGLTYRDLASRINYGKTTISETLRRPQPPDWAFVQAVLTAIAGQDARAHDRLLSAGRSRWERAALPADGPNAPAGLPHTTTPGARPVEPGTPLGDRNAELEQGRAAEVDAVGGQLSGTPPSIVARWSSALRPAVWWTTGSLVLILTFVLAFVWARPHTATPQRAGSSPALPSLTASHPRIPGDSSAFVRDVTYPDGSTVAVGQRFAKTWEIRNTGAVSWRGRYLTRQGTNDPGLCALPAMTPIPDTRPGQTAQITVMITAPSLPGSCRVDWKMTDVNGQHYFPQLQGLFMIINVTE
ncbi:NBR1-Ig-like domain-containing protein [Sphaerisporangium aureirubrum]|uniref:NBR1-Ig-like domain-containing protein n=1 Tax=Sphaerisporangium aureirubrum TaxID=1544736 RepID=A0ABW1NVM4_9ACTN